ncbi:MAG: galactose mutarotase [Erysipelotrichaceae bacterium]|nr:galactose mutarotase [Erysipelotrichaceae bacterium]
MRYTIENEYLRAEISELGATLTRLIDKRTDTDIVLGFDTDEDYIRYAGTNIGATIGRNCNRIGNARFELNGKTYQLSVNDNMNQLHGGGINGFAFKNWKTESVSDTEIVLFYDAKDGEEGFPGNLHTQVTYRLEDDTLFFGFEGSSDQDTLFNITNHSYFNLGDPDIMDEYLYLTTDRYSPTDEYSLTLDEVVPTDGTPYDFNAFTRIGDNLERLEKGIDNNYVWEKIGDKLMCELKNDRLQLNVYSDLPDMHVYTSYYLNNEQGKYNQTYKQYMGIALECQYYPNGINYGDHYLVPILKKGEKMSHYIRYQVKEA